MFKKLDKEYMELQMFGKKDPELIKDSEITKWITSIFITSDEKIMQKPHPSSQYSI